MAGIEDGAGCGERLRARTIAWDNVRRALTTMAFGSKKKKTFAERYPLARSAYDTLSPAQKKVLDEFSYLEQKHLKADKRVGLERIHGVYVVPTYGGALGAKELQRRGILLYDQCVAALRRAHLTTNVGAKLFAVDGFYNGDEVKTVWTTNTTKGHDYFQTRQAVEEHVFGYNIDWRVPISQAANDRPIYAGLNFTEHPYGAAAVYGSVALVLKRTVNDRCTFINTDTFDAGFQFARGTDEQIALSRKKICTAAQMETLLAFVSNNQLKALCQVAESRYDIGDFPPNYIEAQVHGGVQWSRDLLEIRVNRDLLLTEAVQAQKQPATLKYLIAEFAKKHRVRARIFHHDAPVETLN